MSDERNIQEEQVSMQSDDSAESKQAETSGSEARKGYRLLDLFQGKSNGLFMAF